MFSFFRRSKKEENGASSKEKRSKEDKKEVSPNLENKETCNQNNPKQKPDITLETNDVLPNFPSGFALRENLSNANAQKNDANSDNNYEIKNNVCDSAVAISPPPSLSYANMLKSTEKPIERRTSVKPCGHGTTAIAPRIPIIPNRRQSLSTPPPSPTSDTRKQLKKLENDLIPPSPTSDTRKQLKKLENDPIPSSPTADTKKQLNKIVNDRILANPTADTKKELKTNEKQSKNDSKSNSRKNSYERNEVSNRNLNGTKLYVNIPTPSTISPGSSLENSPLENGLYNDNLKKNLINQEAKFQSQLNDLSKQLALRDAEANKLRFQMDELQRDVFAKSAGIDRLEAELSAAHKETELIRQRIRHLENDLENYRRRNTELVENVAEKEEKLTTYENETRSKIEDLEKLIRQLRNKIEDLEDELRNLSQEKKRLEEKQRELIKEREEEKRRVVETLEQAAQQKQEIEKKWKADFEKLRTVNIMKEQQLLDDFEWKLREVQQTCKKRLEEKDSALEQRLSDAYKEAEKKMQQAEDMMKQIENLKGYEVEIKHLKNITVDQQKSLKELTEQQEQMKNAEDSLRNETKNLRKLIDLEKENLQHMQRVHHNEILDKERQLQQTLNHKRIEIAMYWEERLLRECGRLKSELEQIHLEEKHIAVETLRKEKDEVMEKERQQWDQKLRDCLKEITSLKKAIADKDSYYHEEIVRTQTSTDQDILELRRLMDKIDMTHHEKYEKLIIQHDTEIDKINQENEEKVLEIETNCQKEVSNLRTTLEQVKEQMEIESQEKIETLIQQHRAELDSQWENLINQKSQAIDLVEDEYVTKYKTLEEQFYTQQKSHNAREIELLKTIDSLKNELNSKDSTIDDLQNNIDTLEGGVQVLNNEIAQQAEQLMKSRREAEQKIRNLEESVVKIQEQQENEKETLRLKLMNNHKQSQETIDHLQRKCQCLTKLFEEVRLRYERRESRAEDMNTISDLKQVIAEQEKDLACLNEEKRYFQMRLIQLEKELENTISEDDFEDAEAIRTIENQYEVEEPESESPHSPNSNTFAPVYPMMALPMAQNTSISIPPTIIECDE